MYPCAMQPLCGRAWIEGALRAIVSLCHMLTVQAIMENRGCVGHVLHC